MSENSEEVSIEDQAREQGWVPKDEFRGKNDNWREASEYVEYGKKINPILKSQIAKLSDENKVISQTNSELNQKIDRIIKFNQQQAKRSTSNFIKEKEKERMEAIEIGDTDAVLRVEKEISQEVESEVPEDNFLLDDWKLKNTWYGNDSEMTDFADMIGPGIRSRVSSDEAMFIEITNKVKHHFQGKFENPNRERNTSVEGAARKSEPKGKTFDDLPSDAKQAYEDFKQDGMPDFSKEDFLSQYEWEE